MDLTSSMVVTRALGWEPDGVPSKYSGRCAWCGLSIREGDLSVPFSAGPSFMDDLTLASRGSGMTCGYCARLLSAEGLRASGYGMFHAGGVLPFRKWADIARAIQNPPEPPFVALYATANNQHMGWRAPVNLSRDLFYVRVGLRDLKIRRNELLKTVESCNRLGEAMGVKPTAKSLSHPFAFLSSDLKDAGHGRLRNPKENGFAALSANLPVDAERIFGLTLGETWALRFLLSPNAGTQETQQSESA